MTLSVQFLVDNLWMWLQVHNDNRQRLFAFISMFHSIQLEMFFHSGPLFVPSFVHIRFQISGIKTIWMVPIKAHCNTSHIFRKTNHILRKSKLSSFVSEWFYKAIISTRFISLDSSPLLLFKSVLRPLLCDPILCILIFLSVSLSSHSVWCKSGINDTLSSSKCMVVTRTLIRNISMFDEFQIKLRESISETPNQYNSIVGCYTINVMLWYHQ